MGRLARTAWMVSVSLSLALCSVQSAGAQDFVDSFFKDAKPILDLRLRYEFVNQEGFPNDAQAVTLRGRAGFESGEVFGLKLLLELEGVTDVGVDEFNSTTNGRTAFPVVPDPDGIELNRAQITYSGLPDTKVTIGRQRIILNNARFVGNVGFRQNEQTYDAARVTNTSLGPVKLTYVFIDQVQRIFGNESPMGQFESKSHVGQVDWTFAPGQTLSAYALYLDLDESPAQSTRTIGARATGRIPVSEKITLPYEAEYAFQTDYAQNAGDIDLNYFHVAGGADTGAVFAKGGFEFLGGDGAVGFSTPLGTLAKFQGRADAFLVTPAAGIKDRYGEVGARWRDLPFGKQLSASIIYHDFDSEEGDVDLGREIDAKLNLAITDRVSAEAMAAFFEGQAAGPADRTKVWAGLQYRY